MTVPSGFSSIDHRSLRQTTVNRLEFIVCLFFLPNARKAALSEVFLPCRKSLPELRRPYTDFSLN
jgi:hypothetical protein